jgi:hypothetical protein
LFLLSVCIIIKRMAHRPYLYTLKLLLYTGINVLHNEYHQEQQ